jgi:hypothetical protein
MSGGTEPNDPQLALEKLLGVALLQAERDAELPADTFVDLAGHGFGMYMYHGFQKQKFGANKHWIDFSVRATE